MKAFLKTDIMFNTNIFVKIVIKEIGLQLLIRYFGPFLFKDTIPVFFIVFEVFTSTINIKIMALFRQLQFELFQMLSIPSDYLFFNEFIWAFI